MGISGSLWTSLRRTLLLEIRYESRYSSISTPQFPHTNLNPLNPQLRPLLTFPKISLHPYLPGKPHIPPPHLRPLPVTAPPIKSHCSLPLWDMYDLHPSIDEERWAVHGEILEWVASHVLPKDGGAWSQADCALADVVDEFERIWFRF
jgi:hypothetical protein